MLRLTTTRSAPPGALSGAPLRVAAANTLVAVLWALLLQPLAGASDCGTQGAIGYGGACFVLAAADKCEETCQFVGLPLPSSCAASCKERHGSSMCSVAECSGCTECLSGATALTRAEFRADVLSLLTSSKIEPNDAFVSELEGCHPHDKMQRLRGSLARSSPFQNSFSSSAPGPPQMGEEPVCLCACAPCEGQGCAFSAESLRRSGLSANPCVVCAGDEASSCYHDLACYAALSDKSSDEALVRQLLAGSPTTTMTLSSTSTAVPSTSTSASTTPVLGFANSIVDVLDLTMVDPDLSGFNGGFHDEVFGYLVPDDVNGTSSGKVVRFNLATFGHVEVLDLAKLSADLKGFAGGFRSGDFGYLVPRNNGAFFGKVARIQLSSFSTVDVLDLGEVDPQLKGFSQGFEDGVYGYLVPGHRSKLARFHLDNFTLDQVEVQDLSFAGSDMVGFTGGFHDGTFGYLVPGFSEDGVALGKAVRFDLDTLGNASLEILDLTELSPALVGFQGGFHDGTYGYFVPGHNSSVVVRFDLDTFGNVSLSMLDLTVASSDLTGFYGGLADPLYGYTVPHGNALVGRFDLDTFTMVEALDLASVHPDMVMFKGAFHDTTYAYMVPYGHGLLARFEVYKEPTTPVPSVPTWNDAQVEMLNLTEIDLSLKGFNGGFHDGRYGYLVPESNGETFGKVVRFDLATFNDVQVLDLTVGHPELKGFAGGFQDGEYGYLVPHFFGTVVRFDFETFSDVTVLDLNPGYVENFENGTNVTELELELELTGFVRGFFDGAFGYLVPNSGNKLVRFATANFSTDPTVEVLELFDGLEPLSGFTGGFQDGTYGYLVPGSNAAGEHFGKIVRFELGSFDNTSTVDILDLLELHPSWQGFQDGFASGSYGYLIPGNNGEPFGQIVRFSLETFDNFTVISMNSTEADPLLKGFQGGFMDEAYGYLVPYTYGVVGRFNPTTMGDVEALDLTARHPTLTSFKDGFQDGAYGYLVPYGHGTVCRFELWQATTTPASTVTTTPVPSFEENLATLEDEDATPEEKRRALTTAELQFASQVLAANTTEVMVTVFDGGQMYAVMISVDDAAPGGVFHLQTTGPGAVSVPVSVLNVAGVENAVMMYTEMDKDVLNMLPPTNKLFATQFASVTLFDGEYGEELVLPSYLPDHINISIASNSSLEGAMCRFFDEALDDWSTTNVSRFFTESLAGVGMMCQTLHLTLFAGTVDQVFMEPVCTRVEVFTAAGMEDRKRFDLGHSGSLIFVLLCLIEIFLLILSCFSWQDDMAKSQETWNDENLLLDSGARDTLDHHEDDVEGVFDCDNLVECCQMQFDYDHLRRHILRESAVVCIGHASSVHPLDILYMDAGDEKYEKHPKLRAVQHHAKPCLDELFDLERWRFWLLFRGFSSWYGITRFSVHLSSFTRAVILAMRMHIALWFTALFFQGTGNVYTYDSSEGCGTVVGWVMACFLAILASFLSVGLHYVAQLLLTHFYITRDGWDDESKKNQLRVWMYIDTAFAVAAVFLWFFSTFYLVPFLGSIDADTSGRWFLAALFIFLFQVLFYPAFVASCYATGFWLIGRFDEREMFTSRRDEELRLKVGVGYEQEQMRKVDSDFDTDDSEDARRAAEKRLALGDAHFQLQQQELHPHAVPEEAGQMIALNKLAQASIQDDAGAKNAGDEPLVEFMHSEGKPDPGLAPTASTLPLDRSTGQPTKMEEVPSIAVSQEEEAPSVALRQVAASGELTARPVEAPELHDNVARPSHSDELPGPQPKFANTDNGEVVRTLQAEVTPARGEAFPPPPAREEPPPQPAEPVPEKAVPEELQARMPSRSPRPSASPLKTPPQQTSPRPASSEGGHVSIVELAKPAAPSRPAAAGVRAALLGASPEAASVDASFQEEPTMAVEGRLQTIAVPDPDAIPEEGDDMCRTAPGGTGPWAGRHILNEPLSPSSDGQTDMRPGTSPAAATNVMNADMAKTYHGPGALATVAEALMMDKAAAGDESASGTSGPFASSWPTLTHVLSGQVGTNMSNMSEKAQRRAARLSKALEKARQDVKPVSQRWAAARNFARAQSQLRFTEDHNRKIGVEDLSPKTKKDLDDLQERANKTHENVNGMTDELSETRKALSALMRKTP